jgi:hypothetical protein
MRKTLLAAGLLLGAIPLTAAAMDQHAVHANKLKWSAAPPGFQPGMQVAVISGDPGMVGPYVLRAKMPKGYKIMPHTHPTDENVTVLSGSMSFGDGPKFDTKKGEAVGAGGFVHVGKGMQHYVWATVPTVIQVHGVGPFGIDYVNPVDDPRSQAKKTN